MAKTIAKYGWMIVGIYFAYAIMILLLYPTTWPLFPYGIVFGVVGALLVGYLLFLLNLEKKGKNSAGLTFIHMLKKYRFLIEQLVSRDFKTKYKRSVLGILWSFLNPLMMMTVQYIVFKKLMRFEVQFYATYLLSGIVLFNGFLDCANQSMHSITGNASLITKVYVPKYIYPVSKVFSTAINTVLTMIPLILIALINGVRPSLSWLLIPVVLFTVLLFTVGVGLFLSSVLVFFRDIEFLWGVFCSLWMYATPIIYPVSILPDWMQTLELINPMYYYVSLLRTVVIEGTMPTPLNMATSLAISLGVLLIGAMVFRKTQDQFILYL